MIVLKLFPAFVLFLLLAGHSLIMPSQVYAGLPIWCCPCGTECSWLNLGSWFCACRGTDPGCPYCQNNDSLSDSGISDIRRVPGSPSSTVATPDWIASIMSQMRGGKCAVRKFSQRILASATDSLKFESISFDETSIRDRTLVLHTSLK